MRAPTAERRRSSSRAHRLGALLAAALVACSRNPASFVMLSIAPPLPVSVGGQRQLVATVSEGGVRWSVAHPSDGTVDGTGLYTAPLIPGSYSVTASSEVAPSITASAAITVVALPAAPVIEAPSSALQGATGLAASVSGGAI